IRIAAQCQCSCCPDLNHDRAVDRRSGLQLKPVVAAGEVYRVGVCNTITGQSSADGAGIDDGQVTANNTCSTGTRFTIGFGVAVASQATHPAGDLSLIDQNKT